jgi:hypothetical protein
LPLGIPFSMGDRIPPYLPCLSTQGKCVNSNSFII